MGVAIEWHVLFFPQIRYGGRLMNGLSTLAQLAKPRFHLETLRPYAAVVLSALLAIAAVAALRAVVYSIPAAPFLLLPVLVGAFLGGLGSGLFALVLVLAVDALMFWELAYFQSPAADFGAGFPAFWFVACGLLLCFSGYWFRQLGQKNREVAEKQEALEQEGNRRRKLEKALLRSQHTIKAQLAEHEGICAAAPVGLARVDRELRFARVNRQWSEITGRPSEAQLGRTIEETLPEFGGAMASCIREVLASGEALPDREMFADSGMERIWLAGFVPAKDEDGHSIGVNIAIRDLSGEKRCEAALRESEEKFRAFAEWSPEAIWMTDAAGAPIFANRRWFEATGLNLEDARGRGWLSIVHPDDRERVAEQYLAALRDGSRLDTEFRLHAAPDGEFRWHSLSALPLRDRLGVVTNWLVAAMDVHRARTADEAQRECEARLQLALNAGQLAPWVKSGAAEPAAWMDPTNPHAALALEGPLQTWIDAVYAGDKELAPDTSGTYAGEFRITGIDGETRWVQATARRPVDGSGPRLIGVVADVTERKRAEKDLRRSREALREADRRKDEFLAVLAHELRNPLAPILTSAQLLRRRGLERPDLLESATASIERQVKHLSRMIGDLSDISRIARGKLELQPEILELDAAVSQAVEASRPLLDKHRQELFVDLPERPIYVRADPARLAQAIGNLLGNASKFTPVGGNIHLAVACDGHSASISVRDEGIGIDPAELERVFEPFVQLERPLHSGHVGLGIGLALAKGLVALQGGEIAARSEGKGQGSEFLIRLPLADADVL
jgi:PAS domain S-box-containing protein